uniref:Cytochrome C biogenesis protein CycH n=1 Tax=Desulfacinum infernum TaxID=35837 RepID=A0A831ZRL7_9BACT
MTKARSSSRKAIQKEPPEAYGGEIVLYQAADGSVKLDVRLEKETIWLSLNQMATLFERDKSVISRHLRNIYEEAELDREATVAFFATVQDEGGRRVTRRIEYYNLDAVISVGYRVNSKRGTQFRIWATQVLRDHLLKGYTVNARRLQELKQTIKLVASLADRRTLSSDEATALLRVVHDYAFALDVLDDYDHGRFPQLIERPSAGTPITLDEARQLVSALRKHWGCSPLFGQERGNSLHGALAAVFQTAGGCEIYPTLEEKAAHLLYFIVKDHPFVDGNKRIGAALFLRFLDKNDALLRADGTSRVSNEALVALTLLVAESAPREKEAMTRLIAYLLQGHQKSQESTS